MSYAAMHEKKFWPNSELKLLSRNALRLIWRYARYADYAGLCIPPRRSHRRAAAKHGILCAHLQRSASARLRRIVKREGPMSKLLFTMAAADSSVRSPAAAFGRCAAR